MKRLIVTLLLIAVAFIWAPQVVESAANSCAALEQKMVAAETSGSSLGSALVQSLSGGTLGEEVMRDRYPNLPPLVSCSLEYWKMTLGVE